MYYYITAKTCTYPTEWFQVLAGPFQDKGSLKMEALKQIRSADSYEGAIMVDTMIFALSAHRVRRNKSLRRDWIVGSNGCLMSKDKDIIEAYEKMCKEFFGNGR